MRTASSGASLWLAAALSCSACAKGEEDAPSVSVPTAKPPGPEGSGTVEGSVTFAGRAPRPERMVRKGDPFCAKIPMKEEGVLVNDNETLRNVIVRLTTVGKDYDPPAQEAKVEQAQCMFRPRVSGIIAGQTVAIRNLDETLHSVHIYRGANTLYHLAQSQGSPDRKVSFKKGTPDIIALECDAHPGTAAYVLVSNHPFFAVTGTDGEYTLEDVPAGKHTVEAWHERFGTKTAEVEVEPDKSVRVEFSYDGTEAD